MPIHVNPFFRNRELALEAAGLIVKLDSVGYTIVKNEETAGIRGTVVPSRTFNYNGNRFESKE